MTDLVRHYKQTHIQLVVPSIHTHSYLPAMMWLVTLLWTVDFVWQYAYYYYYFSEHNIDFPMNSLFFSKNVHINKNFYIFNNLLDISDIKIWVYEKYILKPIFNRNNSYLATLLIKKYCRLFTILLCIQANVYYGFINHFFYSPANKV